MENESGNHVCILIEDLEVMMRVGLLPQERLGPQRVLVSMRLYAAADYLREAAEHSIIDYGQICARILEWERREHVDLLEILAQDLLEIAFSYEAVSAARVSVKKPDIIDAAQAVGVEVLQERA